VTFFFDNNLPPAIPALLRPLGVDARHLREQFAPEIDDEDWIPAVGERRWVIVTGDRHIRKNPVERLALEEARLIAFFLRRDIHKTKWEQATWFTRYWQKIERVAERADPGTGYEVSVNCKIFRIEGKKLFEV
jgi:hypothetical protein